MQNALSVPTLQALRYWDLTQACCSQSPPKGKHRYVFILYPQHGRVNAKAPKAHHNFTLHQFEKVRLHPCILAVSDSSSVAFCTGVNGWRDTQTDAESSDHPVYGLQEHNLGDPADVKFFYSSPE